MPKTVGPVVGISFSDDSIQAVSVRQITSGAGVEVLQVATAPIPFGSMDGAVITDRPAIASTIRKMLAAAGISAKNAVVGLPSRVVYSRTVTIPPVPDAERRAVVRGEIDHLSILPAGQGTFDFVVFAKPANPISGVPDTSAAATGKGDLALFFAAERNVAQDYWAVVTEAGLQVVGLEPSEYAAVRTIYPHLESRSLALAISVGSNYTYLQFLHRGQPIYARRIDVGVQQMTVPDVAVSPEPETGSWRMPAAAPTAAPAPSNYGFASVHTMPKPEPPPPAPTPTEERVTRANASRQRLAQEIGRSIEYFGREFFADLNALKTVLLPNDLNLAGLPMYVTAALEQEVDYANAFESVQLPGNLSARLRQEEGVGYAPALGLALGACGGKFAGLPAFDLSGEAVAATKFRQAPRVLTGAIAASVAVLAAGVVFALIFARSDVPVRQSLVEARSTLTNLNQQQSALEAALSSQKALVKQIQSQNLPWTNVLRHLSVAVPSGMGLTMVSAQGTSITIAGETTNPDWIPAFWSRMNSSAFFTGATVSSITHNDDKIAFQMTAALPAPVIPSDRPTPVDESADPLAAGVAASNSAAEGVMKAHAPGVAGTQQ